MSILKIAPKELAAGVRHISTTTTTKVELVSAIACIACSSVWIFGRADPRLLLGHLDREGLID